MTLKELYDNSVNKLRNIENCENEVRHILKKALLMSDTDLILRKNEEISADNEENVSAYINERLNGRPLQYILGEWDFCGLTFKVNENVLIPRPETEILCEYVIDYIKDIDEPYVADLCAGSGCIGLTVKNRNQNAYVNLFEKSVGAAECISENVKHICPNQFLAITVGDIFNIELYENLPQFDVIVSNPPYIKTSELSLLQSEVQREPVMALDGGEDGMIFYRFIIDEWIRFLKEDGLFAFECGEGQAEEIKELLENKGFSVKILKDYRDVDRFVIGKRSKL